MDRASAGDAGAGASRTDDRRQHAPGVLVPDSRRSCRLVPPLRHRAGPGLPGVPDRHQAGPPAHGFASDRRRLRLFLSPLPHGRDRSGRGRGPARALPATVDVGPEFAVLGIVNLDAIPPGKQHLPLGGDDNPIPLVEFTRVTGPPVADRSRHRVGPAPGQGRGSRRRIGRQHPHARPLAAGPSLVPEPQPGSDDSEGRKPVPRAEHRRLRGRGAPRGQTKLSRS